MQLRAFKTPWFLAMAKRRKGASLMNDASGPALRRWWITTNSQDDRDSPPELVSTFKLKPAAFDIWSICDENAHSVSSRHGHRSQRAKCSSRRMRRAAIFVTAYALSARSRESVRCRAQQPLMHGGMQSRLHSRGGSVSGANASNVLRKPQKRLYMPSSSSAVGP